MPAHYSNGPGANALLKDTLLTAELGVFIHLNAGTSVFGNLRMSVELQACYQGAQIFAKIQKPSQNSRR